MKFTRDQSIQCAVFLLRMFAGLMFFQAGGMKLFNWFGIMPGGKAVELFTQVGIGGFLEFAGGALMFIGLFTRPVAFILAGEMAVAYWQFHAPNGAWPVENHGESSVLYCFIFLFFAAYGAGQISVDYLLRKKR